MAQLALYRLNCDRALAERDSIELRVESAGATQSTRRHTMATGDSWQVGIFAEIEGQATLSLFHTETGQSLGEHEISDAPTTGDNAPWCQFNASAAHYTLTYRVLESTAGGDEDGSQSDGPDGYALAPYEDNSLRLRLPRVLVYHPTRNSLNRLTGRDKSDAGQFIGDARGCLAELRDWLDLPGARIPIDNGHHNSAAAYTMSAQIISDLEEREQSYLDLNREDRLRAVVFACHGFTDGIQLGLAKRDDHPPPGDRDATRRARTERVLDLVSSMSRDDVKIILYACSTGSPSGGRQGNSSDLAAHYLERSVGGGWWRRIREAARDVAPPRWPEDVDSSVWGGTSFAAYLRDELHERGRRSVQVYGHSDVAHATTFCGVLLFEGGGGDTPPEGGQWLVDPGPMGGSDDIRAFSQHLRDRDDSLKYRYPWMSRQDIMTAIGRGADSSADAADGAGSGLDTADSESTEPVVPGPGEAASR